LERQTDQSTTTATPNQLPPTLIYPNMSAASSPLIVAAMGSSPSIYPATTDSSVSPIIFSAPQGDNYPTHLPLPEYPFCNCPAHDTFKCTGPTDYPFCCQAHWTQESGNQGLPTPESLPSLVSISDSGDSVMDTTDTTDLEDPLASVHRTRDWIAQIHVNTTQVTTHEGIADDAPTGWGTTTLISADPTPIQVDLEDRKTYGKCWNCQTPHADHLRINCPHKKAPRADTPIPLTRRQKRADKKRPHKPIKIIRRSSADHQSWRRGSPTPMRPTERVLTNFKRNTGRDLIAMLQDYSLHMSRTNFDIWNMRHQFVEDIIRHIRYESTTAPTVWGGNGGGWNNNGWGSAWA
jgi:hypothetical protein